MFKVNEKAIYTNINGYCLGEVKILEKYSDKFSNLYTIEILNKDLFPYDDQILHSIREKFLSKGV